jgi:hypothetical protein
MALAALAANHRLTEEQTPGMLPFPPGGVSLA